MSSVVNAIVTRVPAQMGQFSARMQVRNLVAETFLLFHDKQLRRRDLTYINLYTLGQLIPCDEVACNLKIHMRAPTYFRNLRSSKAPDLLFLELHPPSTFWKLITCAVAIRNSPRHN